MNCPQVKELLPAYLDNEINPSERRLIQAHLTGCKTCQRDLALLSRTRGLVSQSLSNRAAQTAPSLQALSRLQARLADEAQRPSSRLMAWFRRSAPFALRAQSNPQGTFTMKTKFALSAIAMLLVLAATVAFVPPVRAQAEKLFDMVFSTASIRVEDPSQLPGYLSEFNSGPVAGFAQVGNGQNGKIVDIYQDGDRFLIFTRSDASNTSLPEGEATTVNGQPAILNTSLAGEYRPDFPAMVGSVSSNGEPSDNQPAPNPPAIVINYTNANKLTWVDGNTRYEMLSNLSIEEMVKIAAELAHAK